jgi:hypothetical protein
MANIDENKLIQTKSNFVFRGVVTGKDNPVKNNGYKEGVCEKGKSKGKQFRSIRFLLKTNRNNIVPVECFGMEKDKVCFYNKDEKDQNKKTVLVDWNKRHETPPNGYQLIPVEFDEIEKINNEFHDGDIVVIVGKIDFSTYKDNSGNTREQTRFIIQRMYKSEEAFDLSNENFEELNKFTQEIVINEVEVEDKEKLIVRAYTIGYKGESINPATFEIDIKNSDPDFVRTFKGLKYGDFLEVFGVIHNRVTVTEGNGAWGRQPIKNYTKCLEITGANEKSYVQKMYKESDLIKTSFGSSETSDWSNVLKDNSNNNDSLPFLEL